HLEQEPTYTKDIRGDESTSNNKSDSSDENINSDASENEDNLYQSAINEFQWFYHDLEDLLKENDPALNKSVLKFVKFYKQRRCLQDTHIRPSISSFFQSCNWNEGRVNGNSHQRGGKRIRVQVTAAARRRKRSSRGLKKVRQRRPKNSTYNEHKNETQEDPHRFIIPPQKKRQTKRAHDLQQALKEN
ncbi:2028_t:CDS:2, partial [Dentiscutata heterogama]